MLKIKANAILNILIVIGLFVLYYHAFMSQKVINHRKHIKRNIKSEVNFKTLPKRKEFNVWFIFTKVTNASTLSYKFRDLIHNLLNVSSVPLRFNIIVDKISQVIAENQITDLIYKNKTVEYFFYDVEECARKIQDIVEVMTPYFSSKPGTYYSDALFYISLGLYRIAPQTQEFAVLLDCDLYFKKDILLLFNELARFKPTALFGLAPELTPVYRHILHVYKIKHNTSFGEYYNTTHKFSFHSHPYGFQGYNSGVVLINFKAQRKSTEFLTVIKNDTVYKLTSKYKFRGHLGDQDFYTLLGYEYPHLIQTLNCGFNRQLCTWWKDHGYNSVFDFYFKCENDIVILHGNCNTRIPK